MSSFLIANHTDNVDCCHAEAALGPRYCQTRTPDVIQHCPYHFRMLPNKPSDSRSNLLIIVPVLWASDAQIIKKNANMLGDMAPQDLQHNPLEDCDRIRPTHRKPRRSHETKQGHERGKVPVLLVEQNLKIAGIEVDRCGYRISGKLFRELVHCRRHPSIPYCHLVERLHIVD